MKHQEKIEEIKEERQQARYNSLINDANKKIEDAEKELNEEKQNGEAQINDAETQIQNGKKEIENYEKEILTQERNANSQFASAQAQINSAKQTLQTNKEEYNTKKAQAEEGFNQAESQKEQLQISLDTLNQKLSELNTQYNQVLEKLKDTTLTEQEIQILEKAKTEIESNQARLAPVKTELENGITQIENQISSGKAELETAKAQLDSAEKQIQAQETNLKNTKTSTNKQIANAKAQIESSEEELNTKKEEFNQKIQEAEGKLIDAKEEVAKIENPVWYILDRNQNSGYSSFIQDTKSIENLSMVFPIVFFAIAILVSLTSMTRMVEEERQEIGTLKALGYNKFHISLKYIIYSSLACVIGGVIGMNIGFQLLPRVIWDMYEMMYTMPSISISFNYENATIGLDLMYICIVGATLYSILKEARHSPAILLRPKAPKIGKRVLLERITPIWKRLNFSRKVTIRNIFRYKKRFLMTIIGIFGCTSLILAGFGLKDSISKILPYQYEKIFTYDMQIAIKSSLEDTQKQSLIDELKSKEGVQEVTENYIVSGTASKDSRRRCTNNSS